MFRGHATSPISDRSGDIFSAYSLHHNRLVRQVAARSAVGAFWSALTDFAATLKVPQQARTTALTHQPFIAWHVVLRGNGLRVIRR